MFTWSFLMSNIIFQLSFWPVETVNHFHNLMIQTRRLTKRFTQLLQSQSMSLTHQSCITVHNLYNIVTLIMPARPLAWKKANSARRGMTTYMNLKLNSGGQKHKGKREKR